MDQKKQKQAADEEVKKPYVTPELTEHGSVEAETQTPVVRGDCSHQICFKPVIG